MTWWKIFGLKCKSHAITRDNSEMPVNEQPEIIPTLDLMSVRFSRAQNQSSRRDKVRAIVLHHIYMGSFKKSEEFLISKESGVSAHYLLGENDLVQMVNTTKKAWHAGVSEWNIDDKHRNNLNNCTIGIEILNPGILVKNRDRFFFNNGGTTEEWKGQTPQYTSIIYPSGRTTSGFYIPYPQKQTNKLISLCKGIIKKYPQIGPEDILTHYGVAQPECRKSDPFGLDLCLIKKKVFEW